VLQKTKKILNEKIVLENILRSSTDLAIVAVALDFNVVYYNPVAEKILHKKLSKNIKVTAHEIWPYSSITISAQAMSEDDLNAIADRGSVTARELKAQGVARYIGITHYLERGHADTERLMRAALAHGAGRADAAGRARHGRGGAGARAGPGGQRREENNVAAGHAVAPNAFDPDAR